MYKINHKAVVLVFLVQILMGFAWYAAAPASLVDYSQNAPVFPSIKYLTFFCLASLVYLYFTAWLLLKVNQLSSFSMMLLVLGMWLCVVLPNYFFISFHLHLDLLNSMYILSYGAFSSLLAGLVFPLWKASRSIFKG